MAKLGSLINQTNDHDKQALALSVLDNCYAYGDNLQTVDVLNWKKILRSREGVDLSYVTTITRRFLMIGKNTHND